MANIQGNLNKIKNAVLGVDVRDSIHDGIKAINEEVENTTDRQVQLEGTFDELVINAGNSNAEVAAARVDSTGKSHGTLGKRLNNFDSQIKDKASNKDLEVERQRINNLTKLQEGSTTGDAELTDIRIGANGTTYDTAGDSVRTQVRLLGNDILYDKEDKFTLNLYTTFIRGGLSNGNVVTTGNKYRIVSQDIITLTNDVIISVVAGFRMGIHTVDSNGNFIKDSGWLTDAIMLKNGTRFRIVIARISSSEDTSEIADMNEFTKAVILKDALLFDKHDVCNSLVEEIAIKGSYFTNNAGISNNRLHAKDIECTNKFKIILSQHSTLQYGIDLYTNDGNRTLISQSGWIDCKKGAYCKDITEPCIVHISFKKADNSAFNAISDANGTVIVYNLMHISKELQTLHENQSKILSPSGFYFNGAYDAILANSRIHSKLLKCNKNDFVQVELLDKDNYMYGVDIYKLDGKTKISSSGWQRNEVITINIEEDSYADIILRKIDNSQFRSIDEMDGKIEVKKLDKVDSFIFNNANVGKDDKHKKMWLTSAHRGLVESTLHENTLGAFYNAYLNGADMIETDARLTADGVLIANHNATAVGKDPTTGETVTYTVAETNADVLCSLILSEDDKWGIQKIPTLEQVFNLAYNTGMIVNVDLKNGYAGAEPVAKLVWKCGMRGKVIYGLNGSGMTAINKIIELDPDAKFIDRPVNFTKENLSSLEDYEKRCYAYTADFSQSNIDSIRESGCMLATISLDASNFSEAIKHHPEMCEYPHTSDFNAIEKAYFSKLKLY